MITVADLIAYRRSMGNSWLKRKPVLVGAVRGNWWH